MDSHAVAQRVARHAYGRLLAHLAYRWRNIAAAEDALSEAFARALEHWPRDGIPNSPEAWLTTVAKRQLLQAARHHRVTEDPAAAIVLARDEQSDFESIGVEDHRLRLMFVCAHPAIDSAVHAPLMLQTVLGLDAKHIAGAMLVQPTALAQRLVRAKAKVKACGIRFELPDVDEFKSRSQAVLEGIYAAYGLGWHHANAIHLGVHTQEALAQEALFLAELCALQLPDDAEAQGLLALLQFCEGRRAASIGKSGEFVPLLDQNPKRWNAALIKQAEDNLRRAAAFGNPGPFQIEAAIQSAHCERAKAGETPWAAIAVLYEGLVQLAPSIAAQVARAVAIGESSTAAQGIQALDAIPQDLVRTYQPYWAALAHLCVQHNDTVRAKSAYQTAVGLTDNSSVREYLLKQMRQLQ